MNKTQEVFHISGKAGPVTEKFRGRLVESWPLRLEKHFGCTCSRAPDLNRVKWRKKADSVTMLCRMLSPSPSISGECMDHQGNQKNQKHTT